MKFFAHSVSEAILIVALDEQVFGGPQAVEFSEQLQQAVENGVRGVVVDLKQVQFMNSSGLGMLVSGLTYVRKHNCRLTLAAVPEKVVSLLKITRLNTVFETFTSVDAAVEKLTAE